MTDLEMTRLCAEALGYFPIASAMQARGETEPKYWRYGNREIAMSAYDPLHNDAQAMELVKRFPRDCFLAFGAHCDEVGWEPLGLSLNRAIVECVAKLQSSKNMQKAKAK